jgi:hypothetical protein
MFDEVREWSNRHRWNPAVAAAFNRLLRRDLLRLPGIADGKNQVGKSNAASRLWAQGWTWLGRRCISQSARITLQRLHNRRLRATVSRQLRSGNKEGAKAAFLQLIDGWVHLSRLQFLASQTRKQTTAELRPNPHCSEWLPGKL